MSGFKAFDDIRPQENAKYCKIRKLKINSRILPFIFISMAVPALCVVNYVTFRLYGNLKNELTNTYKALEQERAINEQLENESVKLKTKYDELFAAFNKLNREFDEVSRESEVLLAQVEELKKRNEELEKQVKELTSDNIALQNTLKKAASAGVKPQNYTIFEGLKPRDTIDRGTYIGKFLGTAYTPSVEECGNNKGITRSGKPIIPGISIAVDNRYWPFGTVFYIKGLGYAVAMDTGGAIKGKYRFDFSVFDKKFAMELGARKWDVYLVKMGKGQVEDIKL